MALATVTEMQLMIPELASVDSGIISLYLNDAEPLVVLDGFDVDHVSFSILQRYMAAHLLHANHIIHGEVVSERVADVAIGYMNRGLAQTYSDKWEEIYYLTKEKYQEDGSRLH